MTAPCEHLRDVPMEPMASDGCAECLASGDSWVHLRYCVTCGHTGCCDTSRNKHARQHASEHGHPVVRSKEPTEHWAYCYLDDVAVRTFL